MNYEDILNGNYPLRELKRLTRLTQENIAELTGLSQATISRLETKKHLEQKDKNHCMVLVAYLAKKEHEKELEKLREEYLKTRAPLTKDELEGE